MPTPESSSSREDPTYALEVMQSHGVDVLLLSRPDLVARVSGARRVWTAGSHPFVPSCVVVRRNAEVHVVGFNEACVPAGIPVRQCHPTQWDTASLVAEICAIEGVPDARVVALDGLTPSLRDHLVMAIPAATLVDALTILEV